MTPEQRRLFTLPKTFPWQLAKMRNRFVNFVTMPLVVSTEFFNTWSKVFRP